MATYLLDTSVIIDTLNGRRGRKQLLKELLSAGHLLACCPVTVTEVYAGMRPKEESRTDALVDSLEYYPVSRSVARLAGRLKYDYARRGVTLATTDVTIAAVALYHQLPLLTDNIRHYPMKELSLYPLPE